MREILVNLLGKSFLLALQVYDDAALLLDDRQGLPEIDFGCIEDFTNSRSMVGLFWSRLDFRCFFFDGRMLLFLFGFGLYDNFLLLL